MQKNHQEFSFSLWQPEEAQLISVDGRPQGRKPSEAVCDDTQNLNETESETFSDTKFFRHRIHYFLIPNFFYTESDTFFFKTKFFDTESETNKKWESFKTFVFFWWFRIRYRKNLVSKKVSDSVSKKLGIEKSIGFGIGKIWYRKKVSDSVSLRFWVSSHTGPHTG